MEKREIQFSLALVVVVIAIYAQVISHGFIHYDDHGYVIDNRHVNTGISLDNIYWAFTGIQLSNWHPLTWISHMIDVELFGLQAGGHHVVNVLLHLINTLLLFFFLNKNTSNILPSFLVALLFAIHPAHVESVAWIAERKDVLSTFFFLLTLIAYSFYVQSGSVKNYLIVLFMLSMALMSKPMVVTLPFVMLLMDIWPLKRTFSSDQGVLSIVGKLIIEKIPFFILITISASITFLIQKDSGAMNTSLIVDFGDRVENALVSYARYAVMSVYPGTLTIFYPHPHEWPQWKVLSSLAGVLSVSVLALFSFKKAPWFFVGWFFFLGTLVPVIGIVQVGIQSIADRYTYIPFIGLFIILAWLLDWICCQWPEIKRAVVVTMMFFSLTLAWQAYNYLGYWKYDAVLFRHTLETHDSGYQKVLAENGEGTTPRYVYSGLYVMYLNMGITLYSVSLFDEARVHLVEATRILPEKSNSWYMLGETYFSMGNYKLAYGYIHKAMEKDAHNKDQYMKRLSEISLLLASEKQ